MTKPTVSSPGALFNFPHASGRLLVKLTQGADITSYLTDSSVAGDTLGAKVIDSASMSDTGWHVVGGHGEGVSSLLASRILASGFADYVEADGTQTAMLTPNDTLYAGTQWDKTIMACPAAWAQQIGVAGVVIAVIGSGVDVNHPDLAGNLLTGINVVVGGSDVTDTLGHETKVTGVVGAVTNNAAGIAGTAYNCKILPIKMVDSTNATNASYHAAAINAAANWAVSNNKKVIIQDSWGSTTFQQVIQDAVNYAWSKGLIIIACGQNAPASNTPVYPAAMTNVIGVGASNSGDTIASYSSYGTWLDVFAPGGEPAGTLIETTFSGGGYGGAAGCSVANPNAVGVAALCWSVNTSYLNSDITGFLTGNCDSLANATDGSAVKRVNANSAVTAAVGGTPTSPPSADVTPPAVTISNPVNGAIVSGTVNIVATATDAVGVKTMQVLIDGSVKAQSTSASISYSWSTKRVKTGSHTIKVTATDAAGNVGNSSITVTR